MGARVIAGASSDEKLAFARRYGAAETINTATDDLRARLKDLAPKGVDVVYDPVGGALTEAALRSLAWKGRLLVIGFASGEIPAGTPLNLPLLKGLRHPRRLSGRVHRPGARRATAGTRNSAHGLGRRPERLSVHIHAKYALELIREGLRRHRASRQTARQDPAWLERELIQRLIFMLQCTMSPLQNALTRNSLGFSENISRRCRAP